MSWRGKEKRWKAGARGPAQNGQLNHKFKGNLVLVLLDQILLGILYLNFR